MIGKPAFCVGLLLGAALAAVRCNSQEDWNKCQSGDPGTKIAGCTALIQAGQDTTEKLSVIYNNRGAAYDDKGDFDLAIQDYNQAIHLNPRIAEAFYGRGEAYDQEGDFDRAIEDLDEAIRLNRNFAYAYDARGRAFRNKGNFNRAIEDYDLAIHLNPNFALAYNNRGDSYRGKGDYNRAIQDFSEAIRLNPNLESPYFNRGFVYSLQLNLTAAIKDYEHVITASPSSKTALRAALWLHVAMKRQGRDDAQLLAPVAATADLSQWPGPALKLDLGQMTADEVTAAAANGSTDKQKWQVCEADYFVGEDALLHHQRTTAVARFKAARDDCPRSEGAYNAALVELKRLAAPPAHAR